MQPASHDPEFDSWPVQGRETSDVAYVGTTDRADGSEDPGGVSGAIFYDSGRGTLFTGDVDEETREIVPRPDEEWEIEPQETVGEAIERLGEETGWESLSTFAEEHLESESDE
jgi:hypothetical protein